MTTPQEKTPLFRFRSGTVGLLALTAVLTAAALIVGFSENPPGIALLYAAGVTLVLAGTHHWRSPRRFGLLLIGSVAGFFITVVIHNFAEVGAERIAHLPVLATILSIISVAGFFLAVIVFPMGGIVGALGTVFSALFRVRARS
jgi:hypothetical protein